MLKTDKRMHCHHSRTESGSNLAEFPIAIGIFLLVIAFPLLDLGTLYIGSQQVLGAARQAVLAASKATSINGTNPQAPSMTSVAKSVAASCSTGGVSIDPNDVTITVFQLPLNADEEGNQNATPFTPPVNTTEFIYQVQVRLIGRVRPLATISFFSEVPGLTGPLIVNAVSTAKVENPDLL